MSRWKIVTVAIVSALGVGGLLYARYEYITNNQSSTLTNIATTFGITPKTNFPIDDSIDIVKTQGAKKIFIDSYLQDDGLKSIFTKSNIKNNEFPNAIITRLYNPVAESNLEEKQIKQGTIFSNGDMIILHGGAGLADHIFGFNITTSTSGEDLIVTANPEKSPTEQGILVIKDSNQQNYVINNSSDWFSKGLFIIPKKATTIIKVSRNPNTYTSTLEYNTGDISTPIYINGYGGITEIPVIPHASFSYNPNVDTKQSTTPSIYLLDIGKGNQKNELIKDITQKKNPAIANKIQIKEQFSFTELHANQSGRYNFITTESKTQKLLVVTHAGYTITTFKTDIPFTPQIIDNSSDDMPYGKRIETPYSIKSYKTSLEKIIGSGGVGYIEGNYFSYKIQPKQKYEGEVEITNIFGQTAKVPISLYIEEISPKVITKQILSNNTINILPEGGTFQDVLVQQNNIKDIDVEFQACTIQTTIDTKINKGVGLENYLFSCDGKVYTHHLSIDNFTYRKAYRTAVSLPKDFPKNVQAFKVTIPGTDKQGNKIENYFYKTNIGIRSKISKENTLHVRGFTLNDNKPITQGTITVTTLEGKTIAKKDIMGTNSVIEILKDQNGNIPQTPLLVQLSNGKQTSFVIVSLNGSSEWYIPSNNDYSIMSKTINSYLDPADITNTTNSVYLWGDFNTTKIYGYSDRGLYKAGETIYFAGFVRDLTTFSDLEYLKNKTVSVGITDTQGNQIYTKNDIPLDGFGGFSGSATIPTTLSMGDAIITYSLNEASGKEISYSQNIKIQEYQKPTYFINVDYTTKDQNIYLIVHPEYYFGQSLKNYDINITWSLAGKDVCYYCRGENQGDYYYNFAFNDSLSTGGTIALYNEQRSNLSLPLIAQNLITQKGYTYTLKANVTIRDRNSDETNFFTKYIDFNPTTKIGLNGQPYEWLYNDGKKDTKNGFTIEGNIAEGKNNIDKLTYTIYYYTYDQETQQGIDGNQYYINGTTYKEISSDSLDIKNNFTINPGFITKSGRYLVIISAIDKDNNVVGEVQKQIEYYDFANTQDGLLGVLPNNYALTVSIPKKAYEEGELIPIDILPYQKGANVVITIERGNHIIDTIEKTLDGSQIMTPVKKGYAPNITVNIVQIAGTDKSTGERREPRFFAGYGQVDISTAMHNLTIDITTDKETYKPGDTVKLSLKTTDNKGNLVDARVSVGVIDQALLGLYDSIKEPIPYFFNKLGSFIPNYTNMKLLYQSLKAFANNGSKGGGGNGGKAMFSMIRDDLKDTAYRNADVLTKDGKGEITFTLPENVTTWVIDLIGITRDTRLGTTRKSIIATKDLIIEPNTPQFMTIGDKINVPVKIITPQDTKKKVTGTAYITNASGDKINLGDFVADTNTKILIPVEVPSTRGESNYITFTIAGTLNKESDAVSIKIPLRSSGFIVKDSFGFIGTGGEKIFTIPAITQGTTTLSLSTLPDNLIDAIIKETGVDTYGYTEELISKSLILSLAQNLQKIRGFKTSTIEGDIVHTDNGDKNISAIINDNINTILSHQQSDGSFGFRDNKPTENSAWKYTLSAYIYGGLVQLRNQFDAQNKIDNAIKNAENYLRTYRTTSDTTFMWYLAQKLAAGKTLSENENTTLSKINPLSMDFGGVLRYIVAVHQDDEKAIAKRRQFAAIPTNGERTQTSAFINQTNLLILKAEALLIDKNSTEKDRTQGLQNFITIRGKNGSWNSSIADSLALQTLANIGGKTRPTKESITCKITIGNYTETAIITKESKTISQIIIGGNTGNPTEQKINRQCDSVVIADTYVTYTPQDIKKEINIEENTKQLMYSIENPQANIGEITNLLGSFTTTLASEQLTVHLYIPSSFKILHTMTSNTDISLYGGFALQPFDVSDYRCMPSHRETRYDELFLYYDSLPPITCDISLPIIKAYKGSTNIMPMTLTELYRGKANGRLTIQ